MTHLVVRVETLHIVTRHETAAGAKISMAARIKRNDKMKRWCRNPAPMTFFVCSLEEYNEKYRRTEKRTNLLSGKEIDVDINTPVSCDPSSETYWSM